MEIGGQIGRQISGHLDRGNIEDVMALTSLQEGMLFHYLRDPAGNFYREQLSLGISGVVDISLFERAWNIVVAGNEMLRTVFRWEKMSNPAQIVLGKHEPQLRYHDFFGEKEARKRMEERKTTERKEPFDLRDVPFRVTLYRIAENEYELVIGNHHILYDGWSTGIILKEFFNTYEDLTLGKVPVPPVKTSFKEFVRWNRRQNIEKQETFWGEYLDGVDWDNRTELPVKKRKSGDGGSSVFPVTFSVDKKDRLDKFVRKHKITTASLLYGAWGLLLQKYTGNSDVILGTTVSGRSARIKGIEEIVGLFINTIPLRVRTAGAGESREDSSLLGMLARLNSELQTREPYENTPLVKIKEYGRCSSKEELFDSIIVIENYPLDIRRLQQVGPLRVLSYSAVEATHYDLTAAVGLSDRIDIDFIYRRDVLNETVIRRLTTHFTRIVDSILEDPHRDVAGLDMLTVEERREILEDFNNTRTPYPGDKAIHELFEEQVERVGDNIAVEARGTGPGDEPPRLSYNQLNRKSNRLARLLRTGGLRPGTIAGVMIERSVDMVAAILAVLKAGGAYLPIDPGYPDKRIVSMLDSSGARFLLTTGGIYEKKSLAPSPGDRGPRVFLLDNVEGELEKEQHGNLDPIGGPADLIYIIFTSGSTGTPKGAGVYRRGFMNLMSWFVTEFELDDRDSNLLITSLSFDLTQKNLYASLLKGGTLYIPASNYFDPADLLQEIQRGRVTWINCTPSMFYKLVEYEEAGGKEQLASLRYVFLGGEPISLTGLIRWLESDYHKAQIVNTYGPTECTDICAFYRITRPGRFLDETIPVGRPVYNARLFVPDKDLQPLPVGVPGELLIGGDGVGSGYINDNELTAAKFIRHSFGPGGPEQLLYRTGDRVKWLPDGTIEFMGRIDHQVKIRGFRIEPGEIEKQLLTHENVKETVVVPRRGDDGTGYLCAYIVPHRIDAFREPGIREHLSAGLPDYMVPAVFTLLEKMPLNPNGKVDRSALPEPDFTAGGRYIAPRDHREESLTAIWSEVLGIEKERIGIDDDFFQLGGHSLRATRLLAAVHKEFGVKIEVRTLFKAPTVRRLSSHLREENGEAGIFFEPVEKKAYYPLSSAQKRLFFEQRIDPENTGYNTPVVLELKGTVDNRRLESAFNRLSERHESLRTSFIMLEDGPVQAIHPRADLTVEYFNLENRAGSSEERCADALKHLVRPFDLSRAPLLRVGLFTLTEDLHLAVMDTHHIVTDGISETIMVNEFISLYRGETPAPPRLQYKDYSQWLHRFRGDASYRRQEAFWVGEFGDNIPRLEMPVDFPRPLVRGFEGEVFAFGLSAGESARLIELAHGGGVTLFMVLLAIYNVFLSKVSTCSCEDIVVGVPAAGRRHTDLNAVIGMFVNTLAIRNQPRGDTTFSEFLNQVKQKTLSAFENQDYQFEDLVNRVLPERDAGRNPLFDVMLTFNNWEDRLSPEASTAAGIRRLNLELMEYKTARFDLILHGFERENAVRFIFEYSTRLYKKETVQRFAAYFKKVVAAVLKDTRKKISAIELIDDEEKRNLLRNLKEEKSKIVMEHVKRKKDQGQTAKLSAEFDF